MTAGQTLQSADKLLTLLTGDELGGLHRIHQQTKLGNVQRALADVIPHGGVADGDDVLAQQAELLDVVVQTFTLGGDALLRQQVNDLLEGERVFLVRLAAENFQKVQHFQLLIGLPCHNTPPSVNENSIPQALSHFQPTQYSTHREKKKEEFVNFSIGINNDWISDIEDSKSAIKELAEELEKLFKQGRYYEAGALIADTLNDWLKDIQWDEIKSKLEWLGIDVANFLNGLLKNTELFGTIGNTLAEGINSVFRLLLGFGRNFDFKQLGIDAGALWNSFWSGLDANDIGETFYQYIIGGFESVAGFLEEGSLSDMTGKIGDIIVSFFNNFKEEDILLMADTLINVIDDVFGAVATLMSKLDNPEVKEKIELFITKLMQGFSENSEEWGTILGDAIGGAFDFAGDMLALADKEGLTKGIYNFLDGLNLPKVFKEWFDMKSEELEIMMMGVGETVLNMLISAIGAAIERALQYLLNSTIIFITWGVEQLITGVWNVLDAGAALFNTTISVLGLVIAEILGLFGYDDAKAAIENWIQGFSDGLTSGWKSIKNWWNNNVAKDLTFTTPDWLGGKTISFKIPKLATGGIVNKSTIAMVGEDGAEAVVPLERNLGWIDKLSTNIANKINNGASGGNVTISLAEISKPFYTRSEMLDFAEHIVNCLKLYGVNVAIVN